MFELFYMVQPQTETVSGMTITWGLFAEALKAAGQTAAATEAMAAIEAKSSDRKAGMDFSSYPICPRLRITAATL